MKIDFRQCFKATRITPDIYDWHFWFAWRPVLVREWEWRWLEKVNRRYKPPTNWERDNGHWEYKELYDN